MGNFGEIFETEDDEYDTGSYSPTGDQNQNNNYNYQQYDQRARQQLQPEFEQQLANLASEQAGRGFYGQAAGDAVTQSTRVQQVGQQAGLANQLMQQDRQYGLQRDQFGLQQDQFSEQQRQFDMSRALQEQQLEMNPNHPEQKSSRFWSGLGGLAGTFAGSMAGPLGTAAGNRLGSWVGGLFE